MPHVTFRRSHQHGVRRRVTRSAPKHPKGIPMGTNADVIRRLTDEPFVAGNFETWDEIVASDLVDNDPMPGLPADGEGLKTMAQMVVGTFDDRKIDAEYLETPDGRVVENWVFTGRHTGEGMGIPPSGQTIT